MDLNGRVDRMDEELKLLKNEIKQVLLEVQEHVLNVQSPFAGVGGGGGFTVQPQNPNRVVQEAPVAAPAPQPSIYIDTSQTGGGGGPGPSQQPQGDFGGIGSPMASPSFPGRRPTGKEDPFVEAGGPGLGPPDSAMSKPSPSPTSSGDSIGSPLSLDDPLGSQAEIDDMLNALGDEDDGPGAGPPPSSAAMDEFEDKPKKPNKKASKAPVASDEDEKRGKALEDENKEELTRRLRKLLEEDSEDSEEEGFDDEFVAAASLDDDKDDVLDTKAAAPQKSRSRQAAETAAPEIMEKVQEMDLVTLAGLAQWAERALNRVGIEHVKALLEVSEMTGRIPKDLKDALILLLPLLDDRDAGHRITAKEIVSLMAQLGGFLGSATMSDLRLLPFLLQDDSEVFPSIRR